jgi:type II secretory pathway component PulF
MKNASESVEGILVANDEKTASDQIVRMGLTPIRVVPLLAKENKPVQMFFSVQKTLSRQNLTRSDLALFTRQIRSLMRARVDLLKALSILAGQADKQKLKKLLLDMHTLVKNGASFSDSLARHSRFFPAVYVDLIRSAEASGRLEDVLEELDNFLTKEEEFRTHVYTALAYPLFIVIVGICVVFVLFSYVIPQLSSLFADFENKLPLPTQIMIAVGSFFQAWWGVLLAGIGLLIFWVIQMSNNPKGRVRLDWIRLRIPILGPLEMKQSLLRFCRTLSLLIKSGLPIYQALQISVPTLENAIFVRELEIVKREVIEGVSLASSIKKVSFFPVYVTQMIAVGEEGGRLDSVLDEVANFYAQEVSATLKIITSLLEPAIILVLGIILGGVVLAMLLPIFQINMLVQ